jgi:hypothetical protein
MLRKTGNMMPAVNGIIGMRGIEKDHLRSIKNARIRYTESRAD